MTTASIATPGLSHWVDAAPSKPKKAKDDMPIVQSLELKAKLDRITEIERQTSDLKAELGMLKADVLGVGERLRVECSRNLNRFVGSVKLNGCTKFVTKNKYSPISKDDVSKVMQVFGDRFAQFFNPEVEVKFSSEKLALLTQEHCDYLLSIGAEINCTYKPTEVYHVARTMEPDVAALHEQVSAIVKPNAPQIGE